MISLFIFCLVAFDNSQLTFIPGSNITEMINKFHEELNCTLSPKY